MTSPRIMALARVGALSIVDQNNVEKTRRVFEESVLSLVELPTLDSGSKDSGYVKMQFAVGRARENSGTAGATPDSNSAKSKAWSTSNFRVTIDGLATSRISKLEPITINHDPKGNLEYSNLVFTVADMDIDSWKQWAAQTIDGKVVE